MSLSEHEQELLHDLIESPGWLLLWTKIIPEGSASSANAALEAVRKQDLPTASRCVGKFEGAVQVALDAYRAANETPPPYIVSLKRVS